MAFLLIFIAVAHQCDRIALRQFLQQAKRQSLQILPLWINAQSQTGEVWGQTTFSQITTHRYAKFCAPENVLPISRFLGSLKP